MENILDKIQLSDETFVYNLSDKPLSDLKDKLQQTTAIRIHGLIGDIIKATAALRFLITQNPKRRIVVLVSYNDSTKINIVKDVFKDLLNSNIVEALFLNETNHIGKITYGQYEFLTNLGCMEVVDCYYFNEPIYKGFAIPEPLLWIEDPAKKGVPDNTKIALFRYSGFHQHVPLRHIPEQEWLHIEKFLLGLNLDVHLYGYDDTMSTLVKPENDHRKKMTVLETLKHSANSGLCISTTTYLPIFLHYTIPCLVFADPRDVATLSIAWRTNHNYTPINTQTPDHVEYVKNFVSMWYRANMNTSIFLNEIKNSLTSLPK